MKYNYLKLLALIIIVIGLFSFANERNNTRIIDGLNVQFVGDQDLYISEAMVDKLLIQSYGNLTKVSKEKLVLNSIEEALNTNKMVKSAEVYVTVNGRLEAKIEQRKPIGRISGSTNYYLDDEGEKMPLSINHSARVPIITGTITGDSLQDVYEILKYINADVFLQKNVIGIHVESVKKYQLKFRAENFVVYLGDVENLEQKFKKFKAFYAKAIKDKTLENFAVVNLEFNNQVVCTKI